jgi:superfamily II DNA or RNA helicase
MFSELQKYLKSKRKGYIIEKKHISKETLQQIRKTLSLKPRVHKDYANNIKDVNAYIETKNRLILPPYWAKEYIGKAQENYIKNGLNFTQELKTIYPPRDYQDPIIEKTYNQLKKIKGAIITIPPGKGKTFLSIYLSTMIKQRTLILVHTTVLMEQWIDRLKYFIPNAKIGIIKGKKFEIEDKDFVVCMIQTVIRPERGYNTLTFKDFGFMICDECHHISAPSFSKSLPIVSTKYKLGLSATPERSDNLQNIFYWWLGPSSWYNRDQKNTDTQVEIIKYHNDEFKEVRTWNGGYNLPNMLGQIVKHKDRNNLILKSINQFVIEGRQIIVLSTRRKHLEDLNKLFGKQKIIKKNNELATNGLYIGGMKKDKLEESSKCDVIFATYQLVSEGTDIPTLNTLIMASPKKEIEQVVGRIQRAKTEFKPLVLDICDMFSVYINQGKYRKRFYKRQKYQITEKDVGDQIIREPSRKELKGIKMFFE